MPSDADIPLILGRLRPNAEWGWTGDGTTYSDPSHIDWRDPVQTEPSESEMETEWTAILAEEAQKLTVRQQLKAEYDLIDGLTVAALTTAQLKTILEIHQYILGGLNEETRQLVPAAEWKRALKALGLST